VKDTTEMADKKCSICYGTKIVGGYERWGFETVSMDAQYNGLEIDSVNLRLRTDLRPHRIVLSRGREEGEIITPYVQPPLSLGWAGYSVDDYVYDSESTGIDYYWQEVGKDKWNSIVNFPALSTERFVRFKIVLRRENQTYKSPVWGMIQVRNQISRGTEIKLSREVAPSSQYRKREDYGNSEDELGLKYWTLNAPLLTDDWFLEIQTGVRNSKRYRVVNFTQSEHSNEILSQHLGVRILQTNEIYYKVF
jgi:hypothetical protein